MLTPNIRKYSNNEFLYDVTRLVTDIKESEYRPDVIVGISRGGLIPAVYLSHALDVPMLPAIWSLRDGSGETHVPYNQINLYGNNILLVDDMIDSGDTFIQIVDDIMSQPTRYHVKEAVLWQNTNCMIQATFHARVLSRAVDNSWISYPWESNHG